MVTGRQIAEKAKDPKYDKLKYDESDCQDFVERVLKDCGTRKDDGTVYNWRGVNSMWRNAFQWKGSIEDCIATFGEIPLGAWVIIHAYDGGEVARGYHDNEGNAKHIGIYVGGDDPSKAVRDSTQTRTRDGVGYRKLDGFNMVGLPYMIDYSVSATTPDRTITKAEALEALQTLTKYIKGV